MDNKPKEIFFPTDLEIGYLLSEDTKYQLKELKTLIEQAKELLGIEINEEWMSRQHNQGNINYNDTIYLNLVLVKLVEVEDLNAIIETREIKELLDENEINNLIEGSSIELDTTNSLFKFMYEAFGNYNRVNTRTQSKSPMVARATLMYEFLGYYVKDMDFKRNLLDTYNESTTETIKEFTIEQAYEMITEYQDKVDELGL